MRLNVQTDYALRLLMQLAVSGDRLVTIQNVSETYHISRNHLMKVAYLLGKHGLVETVRGRSGGLRLARPAEKIMVGEVVRRMEPDFALVECLHADGCECIIENACKLRGALVQATAAFLDVLDRKSLADLTASNRQLAAMIGA
ncbi:MAG TPA: Rrf2 family transcriptional regulator [Devosiaceae bacterium]